MLVAPADDLPYHNMQTTASAQMDREDQMRLARCQYRMLHMKHSDYEPSDFRSGRVSIMKKVMELFPSLELPEYLLTLERLAYMEQGRHLLEDHAYEFKQLAYTLPSKYESLTVTWFVRSVSDRASRKILNGILAAFTCTGMDCSLEDIVQIAMAVDEVDIDNPQPRNPTEQSETDIKLLMDVVAVQKIIIETLADRLSQLQTPTDAPVDDIQGLADQQPYQPPSGTQPECPARAQQ
ncbi:hypothetical protein ASPVEDRAFT_372746 [Aspergillus versicolor CBS 583.65]|uniref:Uncharacterized protein n=1 Tax=Aspergillus versicolor CBS 583.65 TaxID=1036611 RepID=A0A1L9Q1Q5_ASPVE|nr:uncharacterized protein ASPVEDRAFT_372746 [Aspergillus versicolor CBS 583.65]OJJ07690.1 hypothetical protein ASPVEDRAFT_372746 [Aspergillus versicolor CBS 583.65]